MKKQFSAEVRLDFASYRRFAEFQLFKGRNPLFKKIFFYGLGMLSALFLLFLGITERNTGFLMLGGIVVLCVAMFAYMTGQVPKRQFKKDKRLINTAQYYVFAPDGFIIEMKGDGIDSREDVFYGDLFKIYETRDAFYLYADKMSAFIVLKKDLRDFTPEQASEFLKSKVPDYKYIVTK